MPRRAYTSDPQRVFAARLVIDGQEPKEVAEMLGVSERSVWRWAHVFRKHGDAGLVTRPRQGRPPKLTGPQAQQVLGWLGHKPGDFGFETERWTSRRVSYLIYELLGVRMNHRYISCWLHRRGFTPQVPQRVPRERNERAIQEWLAIQWPAIVQKTIRRAASLVFTDESGFLLLPLIGRTLAPRGHTPVLTYRARHRDKVSVAAALTLSPLRRHANLFFQTYPNGYVNNAHYAQFLRRLLWQNSQPLVVVQDQGGMHKGDPLRALSQDFPRLDLNMLPPYAPELNPVEQLWNFEKDKELTNFTPYNVPQLDAALRDHLHQVQADQHRLHSFFDATPLPWDLLTRLT
jgi:transposase